MKKNAIQSQLKKLQKELSRLESIENLMYYERELKEAKHTKYRYVDSNTVELFSYGVFRKENVRIISIEQFKLRQAKLKQIREICKNYYENKGYVSSELLGIQKFEQVVEKINAYF